MNKPLGHLIKDLRRSKGFNQATLGAMCGVSQTTIGAWERSENVPHAENLVALAKALEVDPGVLREAESEPIALRAYERPTIRRMAEPSARMHMMRDERAKIADDFESQVQKQLVNERVEGDWLKPIRTSGGRMWVPDFQTEQVVVDFKHILMRDRQFLTAFLARNLWNLLAMRTVTGDSRKYALVLFFGNESCLNISDEGKKEIRRQRLWVESNLTALREDASLVGISIFAAEDPEEAAMLIAGMHTAVTGKQDLEEENYYPEEQDQ